MAMSDVETPLLAALYASATEGDELEDMRERHMRELASIFSVPIGVSIPALERKNAIARDNDYYARKTLAWGKLKGEPKRRRKRKVVRKTKAKPKRKRKTKPKAKWVPRKKYLANLRRKRR